MTYKIRIRHKVPNKVFPLTLRYDDPSLNLPVIGVNMSDTFQVVELTGWDAIRGFIDPNKVKIEGSINEGNKVYIVGNLNIASVVETIEQNVEITGTVKKEEIEVNINGSIRKEEIEVNIEGTVKKEDVEVNIEGTVKKEEVEVHIDGTIEIEEVEVNINGTVHEVEEYSYAIFPEDIDLILMKSMELTWYSNSDLDESHRIIDGVDGHIWSNSLDQTLYEEVWFKLEPIDNFTVTPSSGKITKDLPWAEVYISGANKYTLNVYKPDETDPMDIYNYSVDWYTNEDCTENNKFLSQDDPAGTLYSSKNEVWAVVTYHVDGFYKPTKVHLTQNESTKDVILEKEYFSYEITIDPADENATIEWYKDETCETPVTSEDGTFTGNNKFYTPLSKLWIKVSAENYTDQIVAIDGTVNENITVVLNDTVVLSAMALPSSYNETDGTQTHLYQERGYFPIIISNDKHQLLDYTVSVTSEHRGGYTGKKRDFSLCSSQINIGNEYSIFIATRGAYGMTSHEMVDTTGTFTIHSEKSEDIEIKVDASGNSEHYSNIRFRSYSGIFCNVDIIPYSTNNTNIDLEFIGADDGAAVIDGNTIKFYTGDYNEGKDYPSNEVTFECLNYYRYYNGSGIYSTQKTIAFDSVSMFQNITYELARKYSHLRFSILPNNLDRLKFGVISLYPTNCRYFVIQESQNIRCVYSNIAYQYNNCAYVISEIDLSDHGHSYNINLSQRSDNFKICLLGQDIKDKITVTSLYGDEVTLTESNHFSINTRLTYTFKSTQKYESDGNRHDGFIITIN